MERVVGLYRLTVVKKFVMALTGLVWFLFVIGHLWGNLKIFLGPEYYNAYAEALRDIGRPVLGHSQGIWIARIILIAALALHVVSAVQLWLRSRAARHHGYRKFEHIGNSRISYTMIYGGLALAIFLVLHLLHFTAGTIHSDFHPGDVYYNVVYSFQHVGPAVLYMLAMVALGLHLYHGLWSATQTLGVNHPSLNAWRRPCALIFALALAGGNMLIPLAILTGVVR